MTSQSEQVQVLPGGGDDDEAGDDDGASHLRKVSGFRCSLMMIHRIRMLTQISCTLAPCTAAAALFCNCSALHIDYYSAQY